jgi:hypothetical protein
MGSSKTTQESKIPEYLEEAGKIAMQQAQQIQQMGYMPYMGPEIAAVNPYEQAMAQNVGQMASAFGMSAPSSLDMGMPTVTQGGMTGYSSFPIYQSAMERLREQRPEQYDFFAGQTGFDPITGAATGYVPPTFNIGGGTGGVAPVTPVSSGGNDNDGPTHAEIMQMHYGTSSADSADPRSSSPRPVLRGESTGGGLFSGLKEAKNTAFDILGII